MTATAHNPATVETPAHTKKRLRKVAAATIFGSMLEWYCGLVAALAPGRIWWEEAGLSRTIRDESGKTGRCGEHPLRSGSRSVPKSCKTKINQS